MALDPAPLTAPLNRFQKIVTDHGVCSKGSNNHETSGHRVPQVAASGTAKRTFVREPDRSPQDGVPCDRFQKIGIIGIPPLAVIRTANELNLVIHDLDEPLVREDLEAASPFLPRVYCAILRTAVVNALHLELDAIYVDTGPGKCDCALHTATILAEALPIPVICTRNMDSKGYGSPLCQARLPLLARMQAITAGVKSAAAYHDQPPPSAPTAGFWGVPPRDFSILELFPETTHIYGWARCMENKTPADHELEAQFNSEVPTVFFAQSFCAKTALARYLARKHPHALYLDVDVHTTNSARAKVQAFLELSGVKP